MPPFVIPITGLAHRRHDRAPTRATRAQPLSIPPETAVS